MAWLLFVNMAAVLLSASVFAAESTSVAVTARVAPVREVLLNQAGEITSIRSNTPEDVQPLFYKTNFDSEPVPPPAGALGRYAQLLKTCDTRKTGVIYQRQAKPLQKINKFFISQLRLV